MVFINASRQRWESWLLAAFIVNLGLVSGAGLYESRIVVPQWLVTLPSGIAEWRPAVAEEMNVGLRFWAFVSTGPLTLLALINLWCALRTRATIVRYSWLATGVVTLVERFATFGFFIPTMLRLFDAQTPQMEAVPLAEFWIGMNGVRHGLVLLALFLAVYTFHRHASHSALHQSR
jgi:hypothetical protein